MQFRRWAGALLSHITLFLVASVIAVLLLHAKAGIVAGGSPSFSVQQWLGASGEYINRAVQGDLGIIQPLRITGYMQELPVVDELARRGGASLLLLALGLVISLGLGTLLGLLSSRFGVSWLRAPTLLGSLALLSTPDILVVLGVRMALVWTLSTYGLKLFSFSALGASLKASHFVAPTLALAVLPVALVARVAAVAFDEVHEQLYIRTARAKGVPHRRLVLRHALKNAWIRVAESSPLIMTSLVTGLVVVEYILYFPGVGRTLGLILEKGGQPAASSGIALLLLLWAVLIDLGFAAVRMALDPRLGEQPPRNGFGGLSVGSLLGAPGQFWRWLRAVPGEITGWWRGLPAAMLQRAWLWRPSRLIRELATNLPLLLGLTGVGALVLIALFGGQFVDLSGAHRIPSYVIDHDEVFFPPFPPGVPGFPLGSDMAGRDMLSRLIVGARYTLFLTLAVTPIRYLIALPWGLAAGLSGGLWRSSARTAGLAFSALPVLLVPAALLPVATALGEESSLLIILILAAAGVPRLVEQIRQHAEALAVQPFVEGARAVGAGPGRILRRHIFPHLVPQLWVTAATDMAWTLLLLAQFGVFSIFLSGSIKVMTGFEVLTDTSTIAISKIPDWSSMLSRPYDVIYRAPWSLWLPALCFLLAIIAFNLLAEGLRRQAQALKVPASFEEVGLPRKRLVREWSAAAVAMALLVGATVTWGLEAPRAMFGQLVETPLDRARLELRTALELAAGTAPDFERARAAGKLKQLVPQYIGRMREAGRPLSDVQTDTGGLMTFLDGEQYQILNAYLPGLPSQVPSYVFVLEKPTGRVIDQITTLVKVNSFAVLPKASKRRESLVPGGYLLLDHVILAGPVPDHRDRWGLTAWRGAYDQTPRFPYYPNWEALQDFILVAQFSERRVSKISVPPGGGDLLLTASSKATVEVAPSGEVTLCESASGPCSSFPWRGDEWSN